MSERVDSPFLHSLLCSFEIPLSNYISSYSLTVVFPILLSTIPPLPSLLSLPLPSLSSFPPSLPPSLPSSLPVLPQFSLCLVSLVILGVLCFSKPYTDRLTNIIEAVILFDLLVISFIFLNTKEAATIDHNVFSVLLLLPFTYAFINITIKVVLMIW